MMAHSTGGLGYSTKWKRSYQDMTRNGHTLSIIRMSYAGIHKRLRADKNGSESYKTYDNTFNALVLTIITILLPSAVCH